jgi:hypothetical protein
MRYLRRCILASLIAGIAALLGPAGAEAAGISQLPHYRAYEIMSPDPQANYGPGGPNNPNPFASNFGERLRTIGDTDGDHVNEVLIADVNYNASGNPGQGRLWILNPRTRQFLLTIDDPTPQAGARFGFWSAALGNTGEFVTSADKQTVGPYTSEGQVFIFNGKTGALLQTINDPDPQSNADFGGNVIAPGDLNGDGFPDFVVTASSAFNGAGIAYAFDGKTGALLYRILNPEPTQSSAFGFGAAEVGDVNGDGVGDYQIGAPFYNDNGVSNAGRSYIFSGKTGQLIYTLANPDPTMNARFGQADSDGIAPGYVSGPKTRPGIYVDGFLSNDGSVANAGLGYLFSGATGQLITRLHDPTPQIGGQFGVADAQIPNLFKDGLPGLAMGQTPHHVPSSATVVSHVAVFAGPNLSSLATVLQDPLAQPNDAFGNSIAVPGDINNDSFPDLLIGARSTDLPGLPNAGVVWEFVSQDTTRPQISRVNGPRHTSLTSARYRFFGKDPDNLPTELQFRCSVDNPRLHPCRTNITIHLTPGNHVLRVRAVDPAGNKSRVRKLMIVEL